MTDLHQYVGLARDIINCYSIPEDITINVTEEVITAYPHQTVIETPRSISVQAWITIPKDFPLDDN